MPIIVELEKTLGKRGFLTYNTDILADIFEERETETDWFRNVDYFIDENNEYEDWIEFVPDKHKKTHLIDELPASLEEAIFSFIIGVSIRGLRGDQNEHKTMLIHVTRFKDVQAQIVNFVDDFVENIYSEVAIRQFDHNDENILGRIEDLFNTDFKNTEFTYNYKDIIKLN